MRFAAILNAESVEVNDSLSCRLDRCVKGTGLCKAPSFRFLREIICRIYSFVSVFIFFVLSRHMPLFLRMILCGIVRRIFFPALGEITHKQKRQMHTWSFFLNKR